MKKVSLFLLLAFFGASPAASAEFSLKITEVMYDFPGTDENHEYIKIENTGAEPVDITGYKFIDGGSTTKHAINLPPKNGGIGSPIIEPSNFLILADDAATYLDDNPGFSGSVLDSAFSLNNDGATVQLLDKDSNIVAAYAYPVEVIVDPETEDEDPPPADDPPADDQADDEAEDQPEPINLIINEIMYDVSGTDDGREWIEVYNQGSGDVDLSRLKLFEAETNHGIVPVGTISAGSFAIIASDPAKFGVDWPDYQGLIFDSTFSLSNIGEEIAIKDADGNIIDQISYSLDMGAAGDDRSLQKNGDNFITALPTPGAINKSVAEPPPPADEEDDPGAISAGGGSSSGGNGSSSGSSSSSPKTSTLKVVIPKAQKFALKIDLPDYAISNSSFNISAVITGVEVDQPAARYVWNFGNGEVIERKDGESFSYNYQFPGAYMITLNYFKDEKSKPVKVSAKIKVDENPINIYQIFPDGSVEIRNKATHQIDISGWTLRSGFSSFTLPPETMLLSGGHVVLSAKITKFSPANKDVELFYPSGISAFSFKDMPAKTEKAKIPKIAEEVRPQVLKEVVPLEPAPKNEIVKGSDLSASAVNSIPEGKSHPLFPWMLGLGGIILVSSIASFFIFSGKSAASSGFKIVD